MNQQNEPLLEAIRGAVDRDPGNGALWLHYADLLHSCGRVDEAMDALRKASDIETTADQATRKLLPLLRQSDQLSEALIRGEQLLETTDDVDVRLQLALILLARDDPTGALQQYQRVLAAAPDRTDPDLESLRGVRTEAKDSNVHDGPPEEPSDLEPALAGVESDHLEEDQLASLFESDEPVILFRDVAGLDDVKRQIHLRILAPFKNPEIYEAFRREGGGGILLYGPPGCGKTFVARATAGECGARFVVVGIHEVLDRYWGESEKMIHAVFEDARRRSPTVLFFDEFDALGSSRGRSESQFYKTLVDQLLHEMDGIGGANRDVLVFAATNAPWNIDMAFRRPGRFDRVLFVPPPDADARCQMLEQHVGQLPGGADIDIAPIAKQTEMLTGADIRALCERAAEHALSRSLETGQVHPVTQNDLRRELKGMTSSASEWLDTARNYAKYANQGGQYDEVVAYLRKVKRW